MMRRFVVGVRTSRFAHLVFAATPDATLDRRTPLLIEIDGTLHLAFVDLPSELVLAIPPDAVTGNIVEAGSSSPAVAAALAERDAAALVIARRIVGPALRVERAEWSLDRAWLTVVVAGALPPDRSDLSDNLARELKAEIRFRSVDASPVRPCA